MRQDQHAAVAEQVVVAVELEVVELARGRQIGHDESVPGLLRPWNFSGHQPWYSSFFCITWIAFGNIAMLPTWSRWVCEVITTLTLSAE